MNLPEKSMTCKQAQLTMALYMENDPGLTEPRRRAFEKHLENCPKCFKEYQESKYVIGLVKQDWQVSEDTLDLIIEADKSYKPKMSVEEGWKDLCRRCPELAESTKKPKSLQLFLRIGAAAACLVIGIFLWLVFSYYSKPNTSFQTSSSEQVASVAKPSVKVELVTNTGNITIPSDQQITSAGKLKTLLINGKHRMVMNSNTVLAVEPQIESGNIGCLVKLVSGEIYAHVEHDGNPFVVSTTHGRVVITGTTFDIEATDVGTTLVVVEGGVKFESEWGSTQVTTGQISKIVPNSAPTSPVSCKAAELTAWATGHERKAVLAQIESYSDDYDLTDLGLAAISGPIELDNIDYEGWIEEKWAWFEREFPWIFQLQEALAVEGIEVDYPELLTSSGDIWQFIYPETSPQQIPMPRFVSLLKAASKYGFGEQWLTTNIAGTKSAIDMPVLKGIYTGQKAFEHWASSFEKMRKSRESPDAGTLLSSLHASVYLVNTRTLVWLKVMNDETGLSLEVKTEVLDLLQTEINTANELAGRVIHLLVASVSETCEAYRDLLDGLIERINTISEIEKGIREYEVRK